jgi:selenocysteine lyase/cysteine desulfurase
MSNFRQDRRVMLKGLALTGGALLAERAISPAALAAAESGEAEWVRIKQAYPACKPRLNLNNAALSPQPRVVEKAVFNAHRFADHEPDVNMWDNLDNARVETKRRLAVMADCDPSELGLNRNSTEGLCTFIFGIDLKAGDEVLLAEWDYPSMRHAWEQRRRRDGVAIRWVRYDLMDEDEAIIEAYRKAITPRTKVMHLTHLLHYTGRVLPVQRLCAIAKAHGIQTIVDAAQSFAQMPISFRKMDCDYLAVSLHKWLCAPFGTGMIIVRSSRLDTLWPLIAPFDDDPKGIERLEHWSLGTYSSPAEFAIRTAIDFHNSIGTGRIQARLQELSRYWVEAASDIKGFKMHTPMDTPNLNAVTAFTIDGLSVEAIEKRLAMEHNIQVKLRRQHSLACVRVSPQVYILKSDLDRFVAALREVARTA